MINNNLAKEFEEAKQAAAEIANRIAEKLNSTSDEPLSWGKVSELRHYKARMTELSDMLHREGEYAI